MKLTETTTMANDDGFAGIPELRQGFAGAAPVEAPNPDRTSQTFNCWRGR